MPKKEFELPLSLLHLSGVIPARFSEEKPRFHCPITPKCTYLGRVSLSRSIPEGHCLWDHYIPALIDNLEEAIEAIIPISISYSQKRRTFSGWQAPRESSDRRNRPPPGQGCPGLAVRMPLQGLRRPDHDIFPEVWIWPPLLRPTPDLEVEIPFYLPQLPDDTGPAGMGRNDQPDVPSVEVELPFSASVRQTLTTNPRSRHVTCGPHMARRPFEESELPFPGSVDRGSVIMT